MAVRLGDRSGGLRPPIPRVRVYVLTDPHSGVGRTGSGGHALAYAQVLAAGTLWGTAGPFSVTLFEMGLAPRSVALLRLAVGTGALALVLMARGGVDLRVPLRSALLLGAGGLFAGVFHIAYQLSTEAIGISSTVALLYLSPALVVGLSAPLLGERLTRGKAALAAVSVMGVWLTVLGAQDADFRFLTAGMGWGLVVGVSWAGYLMFGRYAVPRYGAPTTVFYSSVGGIVLIGVAHAMMGWSVDLPASAAAWGTLIVFSVLTLPVAVLLHFNSMKTLQAGRVAIATTIEPFVAALLAMVLFGQGLGAVGWLGLLVLVGGVAGGYALPAPRAAVEHR